MNKAITSIVGAFRSDGWSNDLSGLGGQGSRTEANKFSSGAILGEEELKSLYDHNWLARRIVETFPNECLRRPLVIDKADFEAFSKLNNVQRYPNGVFKHAMNMGQLCGGAVIVLGVVGSGSPLEKPLSVNEQGIPNAGDVAFLEVLTKFDLESKTKYDLPDDPTKNKRTETFKVKRGPLKDLIIHESRMLYFNGVTKASLSDDQIDRDFPWQSCLQSINELLGNYGISWTATAHLIQESSMAYLKLRGLIGMLASEDRTVVDNRMELLSTGRHVARTVFLDAGDGDGGSGEEFGRTEASFTGLSQVLEQLSFQICGCSGIPYTKLFGQAPAGMNATGESDVRNFYDNANVYKETDVRPKLSLLLRVVLKKDVPFDFQPLWEPTEKERSELRSLNSKADETWFGMGALEPDQIIESRGKDGSFGITADWDKIVAERQAKKEGPQIQVTPTDNAKVVTVNELRLNQGKDPLLLPGTTTPDPDGDLPLAVFELKKAKEIEAMFAAPAPTAPNDPNAVNETNGDPSKQNVTTGTQSTENTPPAPSKSAAPEG